MKCDIRYWFESGDCWVTGPLVDSANANSIRDRNVDEAVGTPVIAPGVTHDPVVKARFLVMTIAHSGYEVVRMVSVAFFNAV